MVTSVRSWPGLAGGGPARSMRSVATGSSSSRFGRSLRGHRRNPSQRGAGHPERRLLRADAPAVEGQHEQGAARARERRQQTQRAGRHGPALHVAPGRRREREVLQVQHATAQGRARLAARARLEQQHRWQRPGRIDRKRDVRHMAHHGRLAPLARAESRTAWPGRSEAPRLRVRPWWTAPARDRRARPSSSPGRAQRH